MKLLIELNERYLKDVPVATDSLSQAYNNYLTLYFMKLKEEVSDYAIEELQTLLDIRSKELNASSFVEAIQHNSINLRPYKGLHAIYVNSARILKKRLPALEDVRFIAEQTGFVFSLSKDAKLEFTNPTMDGLFYALGLAGEFLSKSMIESVFVAEEILINRGEVIPLYHSGHEDDPDAGHGVLTLESIIPILEDEIVRLVETESVNETAA